MINRSLFVLGLLSWLLLSSVSYAQQAPPDSTAPGLMLMVLLDEGGTMDTSNTNSAYAAVNTKQPNPRFTRNVSDPNSVRRTELARLINILNADSTVQHQIAVLAFDRFDTVWLSGEDNARFVTVGGANSDNPSVQDMLNRISLQEPLSSSSDTATALQEALGDFETQVRDSSNTGLKPVMLLVTDDVPIRLDTPAGRSSFPDNSPWGNSAAVTNWLSHIQDDFEPLLTTLDSLPGYSGYCALPDGGPAFAVMSLTTGNWVNSNGGIVQPTGIETDEDGYIRVVNGGNFWDALANSRGWLNPAGKPLVYPIDPAFRDDDLNDYYDQTNRFIQDMLCQPLQEPTGDDVSDRDGSVSIRFSNAFEQVRLFINPPANAAISLVDAAGNPVINNPNAGVRQFNDGRQVWTLNRNDFAGVWDGDWTLQSSQNNVGAVEYQVLVDLSQISWQPIPDVGSEPRLMSVGEVYQFRLIVNQPNGEDGSITPLPLTDQLIANDLRVTILNRTGIDDINEPQSDGTYSFQLTEDIFGSDPSYTLSVLPSIDPSRFFYGIAPFTLDLSDITSRITISTDGASVRIDSPADGENWCIGTNQQQIRVQVNPDTSLDSNADQAERDSLFSYTRVEATYNQLAASPTPMPSGTPVTSFTRTIEGTLQLSWDPNIQFFRGEIPCSTLADGSGQNLQVRAILPEEEITTEPQQYSYQATLTPTPTPTMAAVATATPFPDPVWVDGREAAGETISNSPILTTLLYVLGGIGVLIVLFFFWRWYSRYLIPMAYVLYVRESADGKSRRRARILPEWRRYIPIYQRCRFVSKNENGDTTWLFTISVTSDSKIRIHPGTELDIDRRRVTTRTPQDSERGEIDIRANGEKFTIINRHPSKPKR